MSKLFSFVSFFIFLAGLYTFGQGVKKDTLLLYNMPEEVTISGMRINLPLNEIPFSTSIVPKTTLDKMIRGFGPEEAFKLVPGVKIDNQANGSRVHVSMRGIGILTERGIRGIRIMFDDIPVNDPAGFAPDLFDADFQNLERVEVFRGPAASLYGGSAAGGIINLISTKPENRPLFGQISGTIGSNNFWKFNSQFGGTVDNVSYRLFVSRTMGDGYRQHTQFWNNNFYGKVNYKATEKLNFSLITGYTHAYHQNPEGINMDYYIRDPKLPNDDAIRFNEGLETERGLGGITGAYSFSTNTALKFNAYIKHTFFTEGNNHTVTRRNINTPGGSVQLDFGIKNKKEVFSNTISIGADFQYQNIKEEQRYNLLYADQLHPYEEDTLRTKEEYKQSGLGVFAIDKVNLGAGVNFILSLRYDNITNELIDNLKLSSDLSGSKDFNRFTVRAGLTYEVTDMLTIYGNWGQGFMPPATEELMNNPKVLGGFNEDLTFATSNSFDAGIRGSLLNNLSFELSGFYVTTDNDFDRFRVSSMGTQTFYRNFGGSKRFGGELYAIYAPINEAQIQAAYTYSNFKYSIDAPMLIMMDNPPAKYIVDGNFLPNSPQHQLMIDLQVIPISGLTIGVGSESYSKSFIDGANVESEAVEGFTLFNCRVSYDLAPLGFNSEITFSGRNLADKKYVAFSEPDPGGNAYQPGAGREFFGSIKIKL